jgi:hypothetical protein
MELVVIGKLAGLARYVAELVISDQRGAAVVLPPTKVLRRGCCTVLYDTLECGRKTTFAGGSERGIVWKPVVAG